MSKDEKLEDAYSCLLSILDVLKLADTNSLDGEETLSEIMFRKMGSHGIDLNKELGFTHLSPVKLSRQLLTNGTINHHADTIKEAKDYLLYRYRQLGKFGVRPVREIVHNSGIVTIYSHIIDSFSGANTFIADELVSFYVFSSKRGHGVFKRVMSAPEYRYKKLVTMHECGDDVENFFIKHNYRYISMKHSDAYEKISDYYGDKRAERSGRPLIYHIDEGGAILKRLNVRDVVMDAYYLHPLLQDDKSFMQFFNGDFPNISSEAIILAMEYRHVANSYLSDKPVGTKPLNMINADIKNMLIADKVQNYKDFLKYHKGVHERSDELDAYFNDWFKILDVDYNLLVQFIEYGHLD